MRFINALVIGMGFVVDLFRRHTGEDGVVDHLGLKFAMVGGGWYSNIYQYRVVLRGGRLAPPTFERWRGELACAMDQAAVKLMYGDIIVFVHKDSRADPPEGKAWIFDGRAVVPLPADKTATAVMLAVNLIKNTSMYTYHNRKYSVV